MNASVENERLLERLRAAEKPSLASAAESEKLGKRIAQLECDLREAAAKHARESDELRLHCAQLAQQAAEQVEELGPLQRRRALQKGDLQRVLAAVEHVLEQRAHRPGVQLVDQLAHPQDGLVGR